jgi:hypothetical protein
LADGTHWFGKDFGNPKNLLMILATVALEFKLVQPGKNRATTVGAIQTSYACRKSPA